MAAFTDLSHRKDTTRAGLDTGYRGTVRGTPLALATSEGSNGYPATLRCASLSAAVPCLPVSYAAHAA